jgi:hypothetical protein
VKRPVNRAYFPGVGRGGAFPNSSSVVGYFAGSVTYFLGLGVGVGVGSNKASYLLLLRVSVGKAQSGGESSNKSAYFPLPDFRPLRLADRICQVSVYLRGQ